MGIEPKRTAVPNLENKRFGAMANAKCDWRVNFLGMRGNVGLRETTAPLAFQSPFAPWGTREIFPILGPNCRSLIFEGPKQLSRNRAAT